MVDLVPAAKDNPATESADYKAMKDGWRLIHHIIDGIDRIKEQRWDYLPQFQKETNSAYDIRVKSAPWRPEFVDALLGICAKPFTKEVKVNPDAPDSIQGEVDKNTKKRKGGIVDDIDGQGNSLHVFARDTFVSGVSYGLDAIYVSFPVVQTEGIPTVAAEKKIGARPYWVHVAAEDIIALTVKVVAGRTIPDHIRIKECTIEQDGFAENEVYRIRVLDYNDGAPTWSLWLKNEKGIYEEEISRTPFVGVTEIPLVLYFTGKRESNYRVKPPMIDLAHMQIELYQALSRQERILTLAGSPMLKGVGMGPPKPSKITGANGQMIDVPAAHIEVGPGIVLFAPPAEGIQTDWDYVQPQAANITEVREGVNDIMEDFRRLALQPSTPKSGNMVATGEAINAAKSHSAIEVWANGLKDALDQALAYTCQWMKIADTVTAMVHTDFGVDVQGAEEAKILGDAQSRGVISSETERGELARRGILGPGFDEEEETARLADEQQGLQGEQAIDPRTGLPVKIDPTTGLPGVGKDAPPTSKKNPSRFVDNGGPGLAVH